MKELFKKSDRLRDLKRDIQVYADKAKERIKKICDDHQAKFSQEAAAIIIQKAFRSKKIKEAILTSPYFSYLSMIDRSDEQFQLSAIMFGRHVAELRIGSRERVDNPLINTAEYYHRSQNLQNDAVYAFLREFEIPRSLEHSDQYTYIVITRLKNSPVEEDILNYFNNHSEKGDRKDLVLLEKKPYTIAILAIPTDGLDTRFALSELTLDEFLILKGDNNIKQYLKNATNDHYLDVPFTQKEFDELKRAIEKSTKVEIKKLGEKLVLGFVDHVKDRIRHFGLVASSWEIAENVRYTKVGDQLLDELKDKPKVKFDPSLPKTKDELLKSDIILKLNRIASSGKRYATKKLASCLRNMLEGMPELSEGAIKRIALMLDMTNRFYENHYPRYAFCVYAIVHEISLALLSNKDKAFLDREYEAFLQESRSTLNKILALDEENLSNSTFAAISSTSGVNSYAIAMRIAATMKTTDGLPPRVHTVTPCYYELPSISSLKEANPADDADIFMISAGPIVNPEGLTPGVDINLFVKNHIMDARRDKPTTIIIDATTALYKNIKLNEDVKKLVEDGKLSIIIHESHQKFGLIHTDQAQYGRAFGWFSNKQFDVSELGRFQQNAREDFDNHVDIRIGSFISTHCSNILEDIKKRHFTNGGILRSILSETKLATMSIVEHDDMLTDLDELYFLNSPETTPGSLTSKLEQSAYGVIDHRSSFGHYAPTTASVIEMRRFSPDATDDIDCLIEASHIRLAADDTSKTMLKNLIAEAKIKEDLSLDEQIIIIGMLHSIIFNVRLYPSAIDEVYLTILTDKNNKKVMDDLKNKIVQAKGTVSLIRRPDNTIAIGYCSFDNQFRQIIITDPEIKSLGLTGKKSGKIEGVAAIKAIKAHINKLQANAIPDNANLAVVYAAMRNALDCCPLFKNRQYMLNIKAWLTQVREKIIKEYEPTNKVDFLYAIRVMYSIGIQPKDAELKLISKNRLLCKSIKKAKSKSEAEKLIALYLLKDNLDYRAAISKVRKANFEILFSLPKSKEIEKGSSVYFKTCSEALDSYYSKYNPLQQDKVELLTKLKVAETTYLKALPKEAIFAKILRSILMSVTTFVGALLVVPLYNHYKNTGRVLFFGAPSAELKLQDTRFELDKLSSSKT